MCKGPTVESKLTGSKGKETVSKYSWEDVKKHITPEDAWVVYNNLYMMYLIGMIIQVEV